MSASGAIIYRKFSTRAFASGIPTTLAGSPVVSVYKDSSTTQSTAGVTLTVDFDGVAGLNHVTIDTGADATFYANGSHFDLVITTGTVGGTSVVGEVVGDINLEAASTFPTNFSLLSIDGSGRVDVGKIAGQTASAAGAVTFPGTIASTTNITAGTMTTTTNLTNLPAITADWLTGTGVAASAVTKIQSGLATPTNITAGTITTVTNLTNLPSIPANWITAAGIAADAIGASELATDAVTEIAGGVLNAVAASYNTAGTIGAKINSASGGTVTSNITSINGTTFTGPNLPVVLADGVAHGGTPGSSTATLSMLQVAFAPATALSINSDGTFNVNLTDPYSPNVRADDIPDQAGVGASEVRLSNAFDDHVLRGNLICFLAGPSASFQSRTIVENIGALVTVDRPWTFQPVAGDHALVRYANYAIGSSPGGTIGADVVSFSAPALAQFFTLDTGEKYAAPYSDAVPGSVIFEIVSNAGIDEAQLLVDIDEQLSGTHGAGAWTGGGGGGLDAAGIRNAIGMASADLDVQLAAIKAEEDSISTTLNTVAGDVTTIITNTTGTLDAAGIRAAIGMATANLDGQLAGIDAHVLSRLASSAYTTPLDAVGIRNAIGLVTNNLDTQLGLIPTAAQNADKLLGRNVGGSADGGRTVSEALYFLRNRWTIIGGTLTVYAANDSSVAWTGGVSQASSTPVTGIDPA